MQKLQLNKKGQRQVKPCKNYNTSVRKYLAHLAELNFQNANIIKAALKLEASVTNAV